MRQSTSDKCFNINLFGWY